MYAYAHDLQDSPDPTRPGHQVLASCAGMWPLH